MTERVTIAVDGMGGDSAPQPVLAGIDLALADDLDLAVIVTGPANVVEPFAATRSDRVTAVPTSQVIEMGEHPATAVRSKRDSSIVVGATLVRDRRADGFFSAGSTGAVMAAATLVTGRIRGVQRPAIAAALPTRRGPVVLLDVGANSDCKPEHLLQFAHMGAAYASIALGTREPRVALLNIGEEPTKGSQLAIDAHELMKADVPGFVGNLEARRLMDGDVDVVVTDGFTGNVALKLLEGSSAVLIGQIRQAMTSSVWRKVLAAGLRPALASVKDRMNPDVYGGAPLLGVAGVCIIGHGSSNEVAVRNGIAVAAKAARGHLDKAISERIQAAT